MKMTNLTEFNEQEILQALKEDEIKQLSFVNKSLGFTSFIASTDERSKNYKKSLKITDNETQFKQWKWDKIIVGIVLILLSSLFIKVLMTQRNLYTSAYVIIPIFLILMWIAIASHYYNKKQNFSIILSREALTIKEDVFTWEEIYKTYIICRPQQNETGRRYFLVLIHKNGKTSKYEFTNLISWENMLDKLAAYIEHYKNFA